MKHYLLPIFTLVLLATTFSCEKEEPNDPEPSEPTMPPLTHQGLNTFGCYIDGELFVANEGPSVWSIPPVSGSFDEEPGELRIQGTKYSDDKYHSDVSFKINNVDETGNYSMYSFGSELKGLITSGSSNCDYYHDTLNYGTVTITHLNLADNIIAGRFNMTLINENCETDTIMEITDGRFDFRY